MKKIFLVLILVSFLTLPSLTTPTKATDECVEVIEHLFLAESSGCWWSCTEYVCPWEEHSHWKMMCPGSPVREWQTSGPCYQ